MFGWKLYNKMFMFLGVRLFWYFCDPFAFKGLHQTKKDIQYE